MFSKHVKYSISDELDEIHCPSHLILIRPLKCWACFQIFSILQDACKLDRMVPATSIKAKTARCCKISKIHYWQRISYVNCLVAKYNFAEKVELTRQPFSFLNCLQGDCNIKVIFESSIHLIHKEIWHPTLHPTRNDVGKFIFVLYVHQNSL